jgi:hypothetical protein
MVDVVAVHVSWENVVALARRIVSSGGGHPASGVELAELVLRFHAQTVGAASSEVARTTRRA